MNNLFNYSFSFLAEAIIFWQYSSSLFIPKRSLKTRLIVLCGSYFILFLACLLESEWLNVTLYFLVNFFFLITQYKINWQLSLFHSAILMAIMAMCELIAFGIISIFIPHFMHNQNLYALTTFAVFNKFIFFTLIYILTHLMKQQQKYNQRQDKSIFLLILIPIILIFVMITLVYVSEASILSPTLHWMITLSAIFLLAVNLLIFGINQYMQKKNQEYTEMQLLFQKESDSAEYYKMLLKQNENQSILIHDIKQHLQSIELLNQQKEHEKISAYIRQLMLSSDLKEIGKMCDHDLLNAVLTRYKRQCDNKHIAFYTDIRSQSTTFMDDTDLTSLFCNLLDNSMEAAENVPEGYIELFVRKQEKAPFTVITIVNSCRMNPFSRKDKTLVTTKLDKFKHGFGLKSIRKTVQKYQGEMSQYYDTETGTFHTIITLRQQGLQNA